MLSDVFGHEHFSRNNIYVKKITLSEITFLYSLDFHWDQTAH